MHIYWHTHTYMYVCTHGDFPGGISGKKKKKKPTCQCRRHKRLRFDPQSPATIPWRRAWQPTPVFLPGESHGHSSQGHPELDMTEATQHVCTHAIYTMHAYIFMCVCSYVHSLHVHVVYMSCAHVLYTWQYFNCQYGIFPLFIHIHFSWMHFVSTHTKQNLSLAKKDYL